MGTLVGKFAVISGEEYYRKVAIVEEITPETYLVTDTDDEDEDGIRPTTALFHVGAMSAGVTEDGSLRQYFYFFNSKQEMDDWIDWTETPINTQKDKNDKTDVDSKVLSFTKKKT